MDLSEALQRQKACRNFQERAVPEETIAKILNATRLAVSVGDQQPWRFIVVRDEATKAKLANLLTKGGFLRTTPAVVVALGVEGERPAMIGGYVLSYLLDVAAAIQTFTLAATTEGLGTAWMTDFKEDRIKELFSLPDGVRVVGVLPLGFPLPEPNGTVPHNGKKSLSEVMAFERFTW